jgi:secreted trypsin-like serine protease
LQAALPRRRWVTHLSAAWYIFGMRFGSVFTLLIGTVLAPSAQAIIVSDLNTGGPNDARYNAGSYSGVVRVNLGGNGLCSGSLFGPQSIYVLTAAHCVAGITAPYTNYTVAFDTPTLTAALDNFAAVYIAPGYAGASTNYANDVAVIRLQNQAPADATSYTLSNGASDLGREVVIVGQGISGNGQTGNDGTNYPASQNRANRRKGLNDYDALATGDPTHILWDFDNGTNLNNAFVGSSLGRGLDEVTIAGGDSGGPSFDFTTGLIVGVHSYTTCFATGNSCASPPDLMATTDGPHGTFGELGGDSRVSQFNMFLSQFTTATPEPATWAMMGAGCLALLGLARRHSR